MEIKISKKIYKKEVIERSLNAYKNLLYLDHKINDNFFLIFFVNPDDDFNEKIKDEFLNYLIFEENKCL